MLSETARRETQQTVAEPLRVAVEDLPSHIVNRSLDNIY
jgi:hypothetical protein